MYKWMQMGIIRTVRIHHIHRTARTVRTLLTRRTTQVDSKRVRIISKDRMPQRKSCDILFVLLTYALSITFLGSISIGEDIIYY